LQLAAWPDARSGSSSVVAPRPSDGSLSPDSASTVKRDCNRHRGTFQLIVPVGTRSGLLRSEERLFAILQHIGKSIPEQSRWHLVFRRYLDQIAGRVRGMGGDPDTIPPSGTGVIPGPVQHHRHEEFIGKIAGLIYDHFGDFKGFLLETRDSHVHRFASRETRMECLVREAWEKRATVWVTVDSHRPCCPLEVIVGGAPTC
jgi:hypothetical protein